MKRISRVNIEEVLDAYEKELEDMRKADGHWNHGSGGDWMDGARDALDTLRARLSPDREDALNEMLFGEPKKT